MTDALSHMRMQMEEKERMHHEKKVSYNERVKESMEKDKEYRSLQQRLKSDKAQFQEDYANELKMQIQSKNSNTIMSINNEKLQRDIGKIEGAHSHLIPGLTNLASVGTRPIYRTGVMIANSPNIGGGKANMDKVGKQSVEVRYNPITNQIPMLTANPYIMKEMMRYKAKGIQN